MNLEQEPCPNWPRKISRKFSRTRLYAKRANQKWMQMVPKGADRYKKYRLHYPKNFKKLSSSSYPTRLESRNKFWWVLLMWFQGHICYRWYERRKVFMLHYWIFHLQIALRFKKAGEMWCGGARDSLSHVSRLSDF